MAGSLFAKSFWAFFLITDTLVAIIVSMFVSGAQATSTLFRLVAILIHHLFLGTSKFVVMNWIILFGILAVLVFSAPKWISVLSDQAFLRVEWILRTSVHAKTFLALLGRSDGDEAAILATVWPGLLCFAKKCDFPLLVEIAILHVCLLSWDHPNYEDYCYDIAHIFLKDYYIFI